MSPCAGWFGNGSFLVAAAMVLLVSSANAFAQASTAASNWLFTIDSDTVAEPLSTDGDIGVAQLLQAAQSGPDASWISMAEGRLSRQYDEVMAALAADGAAGFSTSDIEATRAMSRNEFVSDYMSGFVSMYRSRGVQGLAVVGTSAARAALEVLATSPDAEIRAEANLALAALQPGTLGFASQSAPTRTATESAASVAVTVERAAGRIGSVSVNYATASGTAIAGSDFAETAGTLTWAGGDTAPKTITVLLINDTTSEGSESFELRLSSPTGGAALEAASTSVTINDDDSAPSGSAGGGGGGGGGGGSLDLLLVFALFVRVLVRASRSHKPLFGTTDTRSTTSLLESRESN